MDEKQRNRNGSLQPSKSIRKRIGGNTRKFLIAAVLIAFSATVILGSASLCEDTDIGDYSGLQNSSQDHSQLATGNGVIEVSIDNQKFHSAYDTHSEQLVFSVYEDGVKVPNSGYEAVWTSLNSKFQIVGEGKDCLNIPQRMTAKDTATIELEVTKNGTQLNASATKTVTVYPQTINVSFQPYKNEDYIKYNDPSPCKVYYGSQYVVSGSSISFSKVSDSDIDTEIETETTVTAIPKSGCRFVQWYNNNSSISGAGEFKKITGSTFSAEGTPYVLSSFEMYKFDDRTRYKAGETVEFGFGNVVDANADYNVSWSNDRNYPMSGSSLLIPDDIGSTDVKVTVKVTLTNQADKQNIVTKSMTLEIEPLKHTVTLSKEEHGNITSSDGTFQMEVYSGTVAKVDKNNVLTIKNASGAEVNFTPHPEDGFESDGWGEMLPITGDTTYTALFSLIDHKITKGKTNGGSFSSDRDTAECGETVTITLAPNATHKPESVSYTYGNPSVTHTIEGPNYSFVMPDADVKVNVTFTVKTCTVTVGSGNNGSIDNPGAYTITSGDVVKPTTWKDKPAIQVVTTKGSVYVTATPSGTNHIFKHWNLSDLSSGTTKVLVNGKNTKVYNDVTVTAIFSGTCQVGIEVMGNGTITPAVPGGGYTVASGELFKIDKNTLSFNNMDGTKVTCTATETDPAYVFDRWILPEGGFAKENQAIVTAVFSVKTLTVTWKNWDGTVLKTDTACYGTIPEYNGTEPSRESSASHTYSFSGWDPVPGTETDNIAYTAQFTESLRSYTITWKNWDGTVLKTDTACYGTIPEYNGTAPQKPSSEGLNYGFSEWNPSIAPVTGNRTYTAVFVDKEQTFTVTWKNWDGNILKTDKGVGYMNTPEYDGTPSKKTDRTGYHWDFTGWDPAVVPAVSDTVYTAKFVEVKNTYTVTWKNTDGSVIKTEQVEHGAYPVFGIAPTYGPTPQYNYSFTKWLSEDGHERAAVTKDVVYTAQYKLTERLYTITVVTEGNGSLSITNEKASKTVKYNTSVDIAADGTLSFYNSDNVRIAYKVKASDGHEFDGWENNTIRKITGDTVFTAKFSPINYVLTKEVTKCGINLIVDGKSVDSAEAGDHVTIQVIPYSKYKLDSLSYNETAFWVKEGVNEYQFVMPATSVKVTAVCIYDTYTVTVVSGDNGNVSPDGTFKVSGSSYNMKLHLDGSVLKINDKDSGEEVLITPAANPNYVFKNWILTTEGTEGSQTVEDGTNVVGNCTVTAIFAGKDCTVTLVAGENGSIDNAGTFTAEYGKQLTVNGNILSFDSKNGPVFCTATDQSPKSRFGGWTFPASGKVDGNITVTANFIVNKYTVTVTAGNNCSFLHNDGVNTPETLKYLQIEFEHGTPVSVSGDTLTVGTHSFKVITDTGYGSPAWNITPDCSSLTEPTTASCSCSIKEFTVTVEATGPGKVNHTTVLDVPYGSDIVFGPSGANVNGTSVSATANPEDDSGFYRFLQWKMDGAPASGTVKVTSAHTLTAEFETVAKHTVTLTIPAQVSLKSNGVETADRTLHILHGTGIEISGDTLTIGDLVLSVSSESGETSWQTTYVNKVEENIEFSATYKVHEYAVTLPTGTGFTAQFVSGNGTVEHGSDCSFKIVIEEGYDINTLSVTRGGTSINSKGGSYTIADITSDISDIAVTVSPLKFEVGLPVSGEGYTVSESTQSVTWNETLEFTITLDDSHNKSNLQVTGAEKTGAVGNVHYYAVKNVKSAVEVLLSGVELNSYDVCFQNTEGGQLDSTAGELIGHGSAVTVDGASVSFQNTAGKTVTVKAEADDGFRFTSWNVSNGTSVTEPMNIQPSFEEIQIENTKIAGDSTLTSGESLSLTHTNTPAEAKNVEETWEVLDADGFSVTGGLLKSPADMTEPREVTVKLTVCNIKSGKSVENTKTVTVYPVVHSVGFAAGAGGSVSDTGPVQVYHGTAAQISGGTVTVTDTHGSAVSVSATAALQTAQYSYAFKDWTSDAGSPITGDCTFTANFTETLRSYTVKFMNGSQTADSQTLTYGSVPSYGGTPVTKATTAEFSYEFTGWDKEITAVQGDQVYNAVFKETVNRYTITWLDGDGNQIDTTSVEYGSIPVHAAPSKAEDNTYTYVFSDWSPDLTAVTGNKTYRAVFESVYKEYTIGFTVDGKRTQVTLHYGDQVTRNDPVKDTTAEYTYSFAEWNPVLAPVTGDQEYEAVFDRTPVEYKLTFKDGDTEIQTGKVAFGNPVTAPSTDRAGYTFAGWNGQVPDTMPASDLTFVGTWNANTFTVAFSAGTDGTGVMDPMDFTVDLAQNLNACTFERTGYHFSGWNGSNGVSYADGASVTVSDAAQGSTITLTAQWEADTYTVVFDGNGSDNGSTDGQSFTVDAAGTLNGNGFTRTGHTFTGWNTQKDGRGQDVSDRTWLDANCSDGKQFTLYAQWTVNQYNVKFTDKFGSVFKEGKQDYGSQVVKPADPSKAGYTFGGWNGYAETVPAGDLTVTADWTPKTFTVNYTDCKGVSADTFTYKTGGNLAAAPSKGGYAFNGWLIGGTVLTAGQMFDPETYAESFEAAAQWTAVEYGITYDSGVTKGTYTVEQLPFTLASPDSKAGHTFGGWSGSGLTGVGQIPVGTTGDLTLKAVWTPNGYTVKFDANSASATGKTADMPAEVGTGINLPESGFSLKGHTFMGWSAESGGSIISEGTYDVPDAAPDSTHTLYAVWKINQYKITWTDGFGAEVGSVTQDYGTSVTAPADPKKSGYDFTGWNRTVATVPDQDLKITAQWTAVQYSIAYENTKGAANSNPEEYNVTDTVTLSDLSLEGWTFLGWTEGTGSTPAKGLTVGPGATGAKTFTAHWEFIPVDVGLVMNGHCTSFDGKAVKDENGGVTLPVKTPEETGYDFKGWFADSGLTGMALSDGDTVGSSIYAKWEAVDVTVTYHTDHGSKAQDTVKFGSSFTPEDISVEGYAFGGWFSDSGCSAEWTDGTAVSQLSLDLYAKWTVNTYSISKGSETNGSFAVEGSGEYGTNVTVKPTASEGYGIGTVSYTVGGKTVSVQDSEGYSFSMPAGDVTVNVAFDEIPATSVSITGGAGEMANSGSLDFGYAVEPDKATNVTVTWEIVGSPTGFNITSGGVLTADAGLTEDASVTVKVTVQNRGDTSNSVSAEKQVTIHPDSFTVSLPTAGDGWSIDKATQKVVCGQTLRFTVTLEVGYTKVLPTVTGASAVTDSGASKDTARTLVYETAAVTGDGLTIDISGISANTYQVTVSGTGFTSSPVSVAHGATATVTLNMTEGYDRSVLSADCGASVSGTGSARTLTLNGVTWDTDVEVTGGALNKYSVRFMDGDGKVLETAQVEHGKAYGYNGTTPVKAADGTYTYTFDGWSPDLSAAVGDCDHTAQFTKEYIDYTIRWIVEGTAVKTETLHFGDALNYIGDEPVKTETSQYTYAFTGWDRSGTVTGDMDINAVFSGSLRVYSVTFDSHGGDQVDGDELEYGSLIVKPADPTKTGYDFDGWFKDPDCTEAWTFASDTVAGTTALHAGWTIVNYNIAYNGMESASAVLKESYTVEDEDFPLPVPTKNGYKFTGWSGDGISGSSDTVTVKTSSAKALAFTANWTAVDVTVKYHDPAGTDTDGTVKFDSKFTPGSLSAADRTFAGWYRDAGFSQKWVDGTQVKSTDTLHLYAKWTVEVVWKYHDGQVLETDGEAAYGSTPSYDGGEPSRAGDAQYTFTFKGWDGDTAAALTKDTVFEAQFDRTVNKYTVTFTDEGGNILESKKWDYGTQPSAEEPTKKATAQYTYTFSGWYPEIASVTGDTTYKAVFTSELNSYDIRFLNGSEVLQTGKVPYGTLPGYVGETPVKTQTAEYTYTFSGWDREIVEVTGDADYTAQFDATKRSYTITFTDEGGNILESKPWEYGATPAAANPTKESTAEFDYSFAGWTPAIENVTGEATYRATFDENKRSYTVALPGSEGFYEASSDMAAQQDYGTTFTFTVAVDPSCSQSRTAMVVSVNGVAIQPDGGNYSFTVTDVNSVTVSGVQKNTYQITWYDGDGESLGTTQVVHGDIPSWSGADPTKTATAQYAYKFNDTWTPAPTAAGGNTGYTAQFDSILRNYTVRWNNWDGNQYAPDTTANYGTVPAAPAGTPVRASTDAETFAFSTWDISEVKGDTTFTAKFTSSPRTYTITWSVDGAEETEQVAWDALPSHAEPQKAATDQFTYTFAGWDPEIRNVDGDQKYEAVFSSSVNKYSVTWKNWNGEVLETDTQVEYGTLPSFDGTGPVRASTAEFGYTFSKWSPDVATVTGNAEYTAQYTETKRSYTVTFTDEDGNELGSKLWKYGSTPSAEDPVKAATAQYTYTFSGWDPEIASVTGDAEYKATFASELNSYDIRFLNGSEVLQTGKVPYGTLPGYGGETPVKAQTDEFTYTFKGWSPGISSVTGNQDYQATFESAKRSYTITVDENGGSPVDDITAEWGEPVAEPVLTWDGYRFDGWDIQFPASMPKENVTVKAKWVPAEYTITFDSNGGSDVTAVTQDYGTAVAEPDTPEKNGYTFGGWFTDNGTFADGWDFASDTVPLNGTTLYAKWTPVQYSITVDGETGNYDIENIPVLETPSREGYEFQGWSGIGSGIITSIPAGTTGDLVLTSQWNPITYNITAGSPDNGTVQISGTAQIGQTITVTPEPSEGYRVKSVTTTDAELTPGSGVWTFTMPAKDVTLSVVFEEETYKLTWKDGTITSEHDMKYGAPLPSAPAWTKAGHTLSWNESVPANMPAGDLTITAKWTPNSYTVEFDGNNENATGNTGSITTSVGTGLDLPECGFGLAGHTFQGWSKTADGATLSGKYDVSDAENNGTYKLYAIWKIDEYKIRFCNHDGTLLEEKSWKYGETPAYDGTPVREPTAEFSYTFSGWDSTPSAAVCEKTYTAQFSQERNEYTVTLNGGTHGKIGSGASVEITVPYGTSMSVSGNTVTVDSTGYTAVSKDDGVQYTYVFGSWSPSVSGITVTGNAAYTAQWIRTVNEYTITFTDEEGNGLESGKWEYGSTPSCTVTPTKDATAQYTYTFTGWDPGIDSVTGDATYKATFASELNSYDISFMNGSEVLQTGKVPYGTLPEYGGETPTKAATAEFTYTFSGWDNEPSEVTGPAEYTAQFTETKRGYTVQFLDWNGDILQTGTVEYGTLPVYNGDTPAKASDSTYSYKFSGWNPEIAAVTGEKDYTAQFTGEFIEYTVDWISDGTVLMTETLHFGDALEYTGTTPSRDATAEYTYTFTGWDTSGTVTGDMEIDAVFSGSKVEYTLTMDLGGGTGTSAITEPWGTALTVPEPTKTGYDFAGWEGTVHGTMPVGGFGLKAKWNPVPVDVIYDSNGHGTVPAAKATFGQTFIPGTMSKAGYDFGGWFTDNGTFLHAWDTTAEIASTDAIHLYAKWTPIVYGITYDSGVGSQTYTVEDLPKDLAGATKEGHTFLGWSGNGLDKTNIIPEGTTGDLDLTAQWDILTFGVSMPVSAVGCTITGAVNGQTDWGTVIEYRIEVNEGYTQSTPTVSGAGEPAHTEGTFVWTYTITVDSAVTVTVSDLTINSYTVGINGGTGFTGDSIRVDHGENAVLTLTLEEKYDESIPTATGAEISGTGVSRTVTVKDVTRDIALDIADVNVNTHQVTWMNGAAVLKTETVKEDTVPEYVGDTPERTQDDEFTYTFSGWNPMPSAIKDDVTYEAQFVNSERVYTITWMNGTETYATTYEKWGAIPVLPSGTPAKTADARYTYIFRDWGTVSEVDGSATYTARFDSTINQYRISFADWEGNILKTFTLPYGDVPAYDVPTREADSTYTYTDGCWNPTIADVTENATYTAAYTPVFIEYEITIDHGYDGTKTTENHHYGDVVSDPGLTRTGYDDPSWDRTFPYTVAGNDTITASWTATAYTIDYSGIEGADNGDNPPGYTIEDSVTLDSPSKKGYDFAGWSDGRTTSMTVSFSGETGNKTFEAKWTAKTVNVNFSAGGGEGSTAAAVLTVDKAGKLTANGFTKTGYDFAGWSDGTNTYADEAEITISGTDYSGDITLTAQWNIMTFDVTMTTTAEGCQILGAVNGTEEWGTVITLSVTVLGGYTQRTPDVDGAGEPSHVDGTFVWTYTVTVDSDITVTVSDLTPNRYTVSIGDGTGFTGDSVHVYHGDNATLTLTLEEMYDESEVSVYGASVSGTGTSRTVHVTGVTGDMTLSATGIAINTHQVTWMNGTAVLKTETVQEGTVPEYTGEIPVKTQTAEFDYSFSGWDTEPAAVTGDMTFTAQFTGTLRTYTVTWANWDGTVLETDTGVPYGETPSYDGTEPARDGHVFAGWNPSSGTGITGDTEFTAEFSAGTPVEPEPVLHTITVTAGAGGYVSGGTETTVEEGTSYGVSGSTLWIGGSQYTAVPYRGYVFVGWSVTDGTVESDMTVNAEFATYTPVEPEPDDVTVTLTVRGHGNISGQKSAEFDVSYGSTVSILAHGTMNIGGHILIPKADLGFKFSKWSVTDGMTLVSDITITAEFEVDSQYVPKEDPLGAKISMDGEITKNDLDGSVSEVFGFSGRMTVISGTVVLKNDTVLGDGDSIHMMPGTTLVLEGALTGTDGRGLENAGTVKVTGDTEIRGLQLGGVILVSETADLVLDGVNVTGHVVQGSGDGNIRIANTVRVGTFLGNSPENAVLDGNIVYNPDSLVVLHPDGRYRNNLGGDVTTSYSIGNTPFCVAVTSQAVPIFKVSAVVNESGWYQSHGDAPYYGIKWMDAGKDVTDGHIGDCKAVHMHFETPADEGFDHGEYIWIPFILLLCIMAAWAVYRTYR